MAQVPYNPVAEVAPDVRSPDDYLRVQSSPDMFGGLLARGLEQAGAGASKASQFFGQVAADDASNNFQDFANKLLHGDPSKTITGPDGQPQQDTGYLGLKGRAALDARPGVESQLDEYLKSTRSGLTSAEQQLQFDNFSRRYRSYVAGQIGTHADDQSQLWFQQVNKSSSDLALQHIAADPDNPAQVAAGASDLINARVKTAMLLGAQPGDPAYQDAVQGGKRDALKMQIEAIGVRDPSRALKILDSNRDLAGADYPQIAERLQTKADEQVGVATGNRAMTYARTGVNPANSYVIGDSLAAGVRSATGAPGVSQIGAPPASVLASIEALDPQAVAGKKIVLSTGVSNDPKAIDAVDKELKALQDKGASLADVTILGVGTRGDLAPLNDQLRAKALAAGAKFEPLGVVGPDGVHPADGYRDLSRRLMGAAPSPAAANIDQSVPPEGRELLAAIGGPESGGAYDIRYPGGPGRRFESFADHPRIKEVIRAGPNAGLTSDAAGRYQFLSSTWDTERAKLGLRDFSPANQDKAAWDLAETTYHNATGGDLLTALRSHDPTVMAGVAAALKPQWPSIVSGETLARGGAGVATPTGTGAVTTASINDSPAVPPPEVRARAFQLILDDQTLSPKAQETALAYVNRQYSIVETETAGERQTLEQSVPNLIAAVEQGVEGVSIPFERINAVMPPAKARAWADEYAIAQDVGTAMRSLRWSSPQDVAAMQRDIESGQGILSEAMRARRREPTEGPGVAGASPDAVENQAMEFRLRQGMAAQFEKQVGLRQQLLNGPNADPAQYVADHPMVKRATAALDANNPASFSAYAAATIGVQKALGVANPQVLTRDQADTLARKWSDPNPPGGATAIAADMEREAKAWGDNWPEVYREIAPKGDSLIRVVAAGVDGTAARDLLQARGVSDDELLKGAADPDTKKADVSAAVSTALKPLASTLAGAERSQTLADLQKVGERLALLRLAERPGDATGAAASSVNDLVNFKYDYVDSFRVPKALGIAPGTIQAGAAEAKALLGDGAALAPPGSTNGPLAIRPNEVGPEAGLSPQYLAAATAEGLRYNGVWLTNTHEDGLILVRPSGYPAQRADGQPLMLTWAQLASLAQQAAARGAGAANQGLNVLP
jgi:muramidase (phage lysozyme)